MSKIDVKKLDLYGLFEVSPDASVQEIKTAYRKKALKVHPDKNPDNPEAAKLFHELSEALKILTNETAKAEYDCVLRAKKEADLRNRQLDSKRRKLKEDLEAREKKYQTDRIAEEQLKAKNEQLRKQNSSFLAEEQEKINLEQAREKEIEKTGGGSARLRVSWKVNPDSTDPYPHDILYYILQKYGDISALIILKKKKGRALVEFFRKIDAKLAYIAERGFQSCPLTLSWIKRDVSSTTEPIGQPQTSAPTPTVIATSLEDYEAKVLQRMLNAHCKQKMNGA